jgi:hypothetical protein
MSETNAPTPFRVQVDVPAGRDEVWQAVTRPETISQWFGWDYAGLDDEIRQIFLDEPTLAAPGRMSWADGSFLEVTGDDGHSVVRAVRDGAGDSAAYDGIEEGWRAFLTQLRFLVERRPAGARRTLYLTGTATGADALKAAGDATTVADSTRQRALVDADGHLVIVATHAPLDSGDTSRVEITVSTYGLADPAFAVVRDAWAERWLPLARDAEVTTGTAPAPAGTFEDQSAETERPTD